MSTDADRLNDLLREVLERRARSARPDGLLAEIVRTAAETPQRPRSRLVAFWMGPGPLSMVAGAMAALVALVGVVVLVPRLAGPGSTSSPDPSGTAYPTISAAGPDATTLAAGRYQTALFEPAVVFTVPESLWAPGFDAPRQLWLRARFPGTADFEFDELTLVTIQDVLVEPCTRGAAEAVAWDGTEGPAAFLDWLETTMSADLGPRAPVTILGSAGLEVEFTAPDYSHCSLGILGITATGGSLPFAVNSAGTRVRYAVITVGGEIVLVATSTTDSTRRDVLWAAADAVLESLEIAP